MIRALGQKTLDSIIHEEKLGTDTETRRRVLMCAVADDLPSYVLSGIASYAPKVINWLWNKLSASSLGRKVAAVIPDSSSMNDD